MRAVLVLLILAGSAIANEDPDTEVARRHFNAGRAYYDSANYERALDEFTQARRVKPHPALDFNIARCLDRMERYQDAIVAYESYAASNPADVVEIRTRVAELKERVKALPPPKPPTPVRETVLLLPTTTLAETPPPPSPPGKNNRRTVGIVLGVLGGAVVIGAAVAIGLLVKTTTDPPWPDNTGGPRQGTQ